MSRLPARVRSSSSFRWIQSTPFSVRFIVFGSIHQLKPNYNTPTSYPLFLVERKTLGKKLGNAFKDRPDWRERINRVGALWQCRIYNDHQKDDGENGEGCRFLDVHRSALSLKIADNSRKSRCLEMKISQQPGSTVQRIGNVTKQNKEKRKVFMNHDMWKTNNWTREVGRESAHGRNSRLLER